MTNFKYPNLETIESLFIDSSILQKVGIASLDDLAETFKKGAFFLPSFTSDFNQNFLNLALIIKMILQKIFS